MAELLEVEDLNVRFATAAGDVAAVRGVSFSLGHERLGIVGESGSGKSTIGRAILRLLDRRARLSAKTLALAGQDLLGLSERAMRAVRGRRIAMVMQDPKYSLNPVMQIGEQIAEAYRLHHSVSHRLAYERTLAMLEAVRIREPARVYKAYPHELSGGMGQRVMIAMMLIPDPDILIADEPTSALDVTVQLQVLQILDELVRDRGMGLIFISHDLNLVASFCDRILIVYAGRVLETCPADELGKARHPYTQGLLACLPDLDSPARVLPSLNRDPKWAL